MLKINEVYLGDCLELMSDIADKSIDLIITDPPYGSTKCRWDSVLDLESLWRQYRRIIKDNGAVIMTAQTPFDKVLGCSNLEMLRYEWVWEKTMATGHFNARKMPLKAHENVLVFYKNLPTYNPQKTQGHHPINSYTKYVATQNNTEIYGEAKTEITGGGETDRYPRSVLVFPTDRQTCNLHPTQKPVKLFEYFIKTYTNKGDLILDNCAGSGTAGVAAVNTGRDYILIEKDPEYYQTILKRMSEL